MATVTANCRHGIDAATCKRCLQMNHLMERRHRRANPPAAIPEFRNSGISSPRDRQPTSVITQHTLLADVIRGFKDKPFSREELCDAAWRAHPDVFGLQGFPHPDSHKVSSVLYGSKGLFRQGVLQRTSDGKFIARKP